MPVDQWPEPINRSFKHLNPDVYVTMQGPSEFGIKGDATLKKLGCKRSIVKNFCSHNLLLVQKHDTMDPKEMEWIANEVQNGKYLYLP